MAIAASIFYCCGLHKDSINNDVSAFHVKLLQVYDTTAFTQKSYRRCLTIMRLSTIKPVRWWCLSASSLWAPFPILSVTR